ncbi:hypothetical protein DAI22_06g173200 [Oryza sativa Japonica Group]|nr:hypothetical protein DAI22_06g173200 [Oryza sativa Japonica Group]
MPWSPTPPTPNRTNETKAPVFVLRFPSLPPPPPHYHHHHHQPPCGRRRLPGRDAEEDRIPPHPSVQSARTTSEVKPLRSPCSVARRVLPPQPAEGGGGVMRGRGREAA